MNSEATQPRIVLRPTYAEISNRPPSSVTTLTDVPLFNFAITFPALFRTLRFPPRVETRQPAKRAGAEKMSLLSMFEDVAVTAKGRIKLENSKPTTKTAEYKLLIISSQRSVNRAEVDIDHQGPDLDQAQNKLEAFLMDACDER